MVAGAVFLCVLRGSRAESVSELLGEVKFRGLARAINANRVQYCIYYPNNVRNLEHKFSDFNEMLVDEFASVCYVCHSKS